jgi:dihydrofolate synthase/folylpolyglutamate synthase
LALADTLAKLYARIPLGMRFGLEPMRDACASFDHPERSFECVHVGGTNGKGSVCAMLESIARIDGRRTGLFTSPHLCRVAERIRIDGEPIDDTLLAETLEQVFDRTPDLSFFESATLAAFLAFRAAKVDLAVIEVGIGGRLDATNVLPAPRAAAITRVALDHTEWLGPTLADIAREKAGIAKPGLDLLLGPMPSGIRSVIDDVARASGGTTTELAELGDGSFLGVIGLAGEHQKDNARIAAALGVRMGAAPTSITEGVARVSWPGRLERIGGFLLDAAHNPDGAEALARHLRASNVAPTEVALVFGVLGDKDWPAMLDALAPHAASRIYVALNGASRAGVPAEALHARHHGLIAGSVESAIRLAHGSLVVIAGSLVLVGEARAVLLGLPRDPPVAL